MYKISKQKIKILKMKDWNTKREHQIKFILNDRLIKYEILELGKWSSIKKQKLKEFKDDIKELIYCLDVFDTIKMDDYYKKIFDNLIKTGGKNV